MIRRAVSVYRRQGARGVWFGALARARVYRRLELVALDLSRLPSLAPDLGLDIGFLRPGEEPALTRLGGPWTPEQAEERLTRGERCFVGRDGDEIVSARWVVAGQATVPYAGSRLTLLPDERYQYDSFTRPSSRGRGISPALGTRLAHTLAGEGCRRIVAAVLPENREAVRAASKVGYRTIGRIGYVKLGPWRRELTRHDAPAS